MHTITIYLVKSGFLPVPRYEWTRGQFIENSNSLFNEGIVFESNQVIDEYLRKIRVEKKLIHRARSPHDAYFRETDNPNPWWREFWSIENPLRNKSVDLIVILSHADRIFVVAHGHGRFMLNPLCLETDFGLRAALNAIDERKIRGTGILTPSEVAMRTNKHTGRETTFAQYDVNIFNSLLKDIAGKVHDRYSEYFRTVDGADSLKFSYSGNADGLIAVMSRLLLLYRSKRYKKKGFRWIDNFSQIRDRALIAELDRLLIAQLESRSAEPLLCFPTLPGTLNPTFRYSGFGKSQGKAGYFVDLDLVEQYYPKIEELEAPLRIEDLFRQGISLKDGDSGKTIGSAKIYQCIYTEVYHLGKQYFLENGIWYRVDNDFMAEIDRRLDEIPRWPCPVPYEHEKIAKESIRRRCTKEFVFNTALAQYLTSLGVAEVLDANEVIYRNAQIELCDVLFQRATDIYLIHTKYFYGSSALSHLFSQGHTSAELLIDLAFRQKANEKISVSTLRLSEADRIDRDRYTVIFAIIKKRDRNGNFSLPLFSRINLDMFAQNLRKLGYKVNISYVEYQR